LNRCHSSRRPEGSSAEFKLLSRTQVLVETQTGQDNWFSVSDSPFCAKQFKMLTSESFKLLTGSVRVGCRRAEVVTSHR
jgi:hypothetical protein